MALDLHDISRCPVGHRCESCGDDELGVRVYTYTAPPIGVMCLTLCLRCALADADPPVAVATAVRLVLQHCGHLNIDADQMAAALEEKDGGVQEHR